jgi:hypothetical protein
VEDVPAPLDLEYLFTLLVRLVADWTVVANSVWQRKINSKYFIVQELGDLWWLGRHGVARCPNGDSMDFGRRTFCMLYTQDMSIIVAKTKP